MKKIYLMKRAIDDVVQSYFEIGKFEIIISLIPPGVNLKKHSHKASQFGTTLGKEFLFGIGESNYLMRSGVIYNLAGDVPHSASNPANTPVMTLDIKYTCHKMNEVNGYGRCRYLDRPFLPESGDSLRPFMEHFENECFIFNTYTLAEKNTLVLEGNGFDYLLSGEGTVMTDSGELTPYTLYRSHSSRNYTVRCDSGKASFVLLKLKC